MATNGAPEPGHDAPQNTSAGGGGGGFMGIPRKLLPFVGVGVVVVVVGIIVGGLFLGGVIGGGGGGGESGGGDVLGYLPGDAGGVGIARVPDLESDNVPRDFSRDRERDFEDSPIPKFGIDYEDVTVWAGVFDDDLDDTLTVLRGDFDFDIIREEVEDGLECEYDDFRDFELWSCPQESFPAVALFEQDGYVVLADRQQAELEQVLTYMSRDPDELANASDSKLRLILDKAGGGFERLAFNDCAVERCEGFGVSLRQRDSESVGVVFALLFNSERAAQRAANDISLDDFLEALAAQLSLDLDIDEVTTDGRFVIVNGVGEYTGGREGGSPTPREPGPQVSGAGDVLGYIPGNADEVVIIDWNAYNNGLIPEEYVSYLQDQGQEQRHEYLYGVVTSHDPLRLKDDAETIVHVPYTPGANDYALEVMKGAFDFSAIREELEDGLDCEVDDYRGYELWRCGGTYSEVAIFESDRYVVLARSQGALEDLLTLMSREQEKLADADDSRLKQLLEKSGGGWMQVAVDSRGSSFRPVSLGFAVDGSDSNALDVAYAFTPTSSDAQDAVDEIFQHMALKVDISEAVAESDFLVGNATAEFLDPVKVAQATRAAETQYLDQLMSAESTRLAQEMEQQATAVPTRTWVEDCYDGGQSSTECSCLYDELESILAGTGMEIPDFDSAEWWDDEFTVAREYAEGVCY